MRKELNDIVAEAEARRNLAMPRIGKGHSGFSRGIFSLLQDPGGTVYTPRSGALASRFVDIDNDDPTAKWTKALLLRLGIQKTALTPWNAFGAYGERPGVRAIDANLTLCQGLLDKAQPVAVVAQGRWAHKMADRLQFSGPIFRVPHPSRRGRASYRGASQDIEAAFEAASELMHSAQSDIRLSLTTAAPSNTSPDSAQSSTRCWRRRPPGSGVP